MTKHASAGDGPAVYVMEVGGQLHPRWAAWFDGMDLSVGPEGTTTLRRQVADQAALFGMLRTIRDLGLPLLTVLRQPDHPAQEPVAPPTTNPHEETRLRSYPRFLTKDRRQPAS